MSETSDVVRSIQGEQQGVDEEYVYVKFDGPDAQVALSKLAPQMGTQRFVVDAVSWSDTKAPRQDKELRRTIKFRVSEIVEYGAISEPETDPSLFDEVDDDVARG